MPYKIFRPIPLGPRLQAMYANPDMAKAMRYRTNYHEELEDKQSERTEELGPENKPDQQQENAENTNQEPNNAHSPSPPCTNIPPSSQLKDVFDGQHYHHLCQEQVKIPSENEEGFKTLWHLYFEDE